MMSYGEELFRLALERDPGLIFIHPYYGTDTCKEMRVHLKALRKSGILVMEDVTQSYYLDGAGRDADFVIGSLRKWYAVPDGGFVAADIPLAEDVLEAGETYAHDRLTPLTEKWNYLNDETFAGKPREERQAQKTAYLDRNRALERDLDRYTGIRRMSQISRSILSEIDEKAAAAKRAENYAYLYEKISGMRQLRPVLPKEGGEAPLYFPIYVRKHEDLQDFLRGQDIYAPILWPVGEENRSALVGDEDYIYRHMLALPVDQRYGIEEMDRIGGALLAYENRRVVGIRVDANKTIAMGHLMRCITIAREIQKRACMWCFLRPTSGRRKRSRQPGWSRSACTRNGIGWKKNCQGSESCSSEWGSASCWWTRIRCLSPILRAWESGLRWCIWMIVLRGSIPLIC